VRGEAVTAKEPPQIWRDNAFPADEPVPLLGRSFGEFDRPLDRV
jgi:hypothetical protein